jgi:hypothetical protein
MFVPTASRSVPTHGRCLVTTFSTHRVHLQRGRIFGLSCDATPTALAARETALALVFAADKAASKLEMVLSEH